jgi:uncharacterized tellurite resistance protein B-like protein
MYIRRLLGLSGEHEDRSAETDAVRGIVNALDRLEPARARYLAAFSYVLSRVAAADMDVSMEETQQMETLISELGGLPEEQAVIVVQMAKMQNALFGGTEDFLVTREFNKIASRQQKLQLLQCLFGVSAADQSISTVEDNTIRQICRELLLEDRDFYAARSAFREYLAVLKKTDPEA